MNGFLKIASILSFCHSALAAETPPPPISKCANLPCHSFKLKNGLQLFVVEDHSSPTFAYQTWFQVGSRNEIRGRTGLAHLFEHLMFKGTERYADGEFDRLISRAGGEGMNAFTSRDYTAYVQELPLKAQGKSNLDLIAGLESERMVRLIVNEETFKTEREVVQNERRFRKENSPDGTLNQELFELAFTKHPYHWPVIGYESDLASMNAQDARDFYISHYRPDQATIAIVGDVNPAETLKVIEKYYGKISTPPLAAKPAAPIEAEPPVKTVRRKTLSLNIEIEKIWMGYRIPGIRHDDVPAINLLQALLTTGKSSRLQTALVDRGIALSVYSHNLEDLDPSLFMIVASLQKKKKAAQAEEAILKQLESLSKKPVPAAEIEGAKNRLSFTFYKRLESASEKASLVGLYQTLVQDPHWGEKILERSLRVSAPQLQEVVKRYFKPESRTVLVGVPKK